MTHSFSLTTRQQWIVGAVLMLAMIITRSHFVNHIQDMSWAVFFLAGFYIRNVLGFPLFWLVAFAVDLLVIKSTGGENFCFTVSYPFLIPAYGALWFAGRWFAGHYSENLRGLAYFIASAVVGIVVCDLISSGGFYWFSGRFAEPSLAVFGERLATYTPLYLKTTMLYLAIAAAIHLAIRQARQFGGHTRRHS